MLEKECRASGVQLFRKTAIHNVTRTDEFVATAAERIPGSGPGRGHGWTVNSQDGGHRVRLRPGAPIRIEDS